MTPDDGPQILDYSRPMPRRPGPVRWFLFRRPLRAVEVAVVMWGVAGAGYAFSAAGGRGASLSDNLALFVAMLTALLAVVASVAVIGDLSGGGVRTAWRCLLFGLLVSVLSGAVQVTRCPHARYLQVYGATIPIAGDPCGNPRRVEPPWFARW